MADRVYQEPDAAILNVAIQNAVIQNAVTQNVVIQIVVRILVLVVAVIQAPIVVRDARSAGFRVGFHAVAPRLAPVVRRVALVVASARAALQLPLVGFLRWSQELLLAASHLVEPLRVRVLSAPVHEKLWSA